MESGLRFGTELAASRFPQFGFKTLKSHIPFSANWEILNEAFRNVTSFFQQGRC